MKTKLWFTLWLVACVPRLELPDGALITCEVQADCPAPRICRTAVGLCALPNDPNDAPPQISDAVLSQTVLAKGEEVRLRFRLSEALLSAPKVVLSRGGNELNFATDNTRGDLDVYEYYYIARGTEAEDTTYAASVSAVDASGQRTVEPVGDVRFDFTPPALSAVTWGLESDATTPGAIVACSATTERNAVLVAAVLEDAAGAVIADVLSRMTLTDTLITGALSLAVYDLADGQTVRLRLTVEDAAKNHQSQVSPLLLIDATPPKAPTVLLENGVPITQNASIALRIEASDATEFYLRSNDVFFSDVKERWVPFSASLTAAIVLTPTPGSKTVFVRVRDAAKNESPETQAIIELLADTVPPLVSLSINAPAYSKQLTVPISFAASDNNGQITGYLLSDDAGLTPSSNAVALPSPATMFTFSPGDGTRTLRGWARDSSQLINNPAATASIVIDQTAPAISAFTLSTPAATASRTVSYGLTFADPGAATRAPLNGMIVSESNTTPAADDARFVPVAATGSLDLADFDGPHAIYAWVRDAAENVSLAGTIATAPFLDRVAPVFDALSFDFWPVTASAGASATVSVTTIESDPAPSSGARKFCAEVTPLAGSTSCSANGAAPTQFSTTLDGVLKYTMRMANPALNPAQASRVFIKGEVAVATTTPGEDEAYPAIASNAAGDVVVVFRRASVSAAVFVARIFPRGGGTPSDEFTVASGSVSAQDRPAVAVASDGAFMIVQRANDGRVYARFFDASGIVRGAAKELGFGAAGALTAAAASTAHFVAAWEDSGDVYLQRLSANRTAPADGSTQTVAPSADTESHPRIAMLPDGRGAACWQSSRFAGDVRCCELQPPSSGNEVGIGASYWVAESGNSEQKPDVAVDDGGVWVAWVDLGGTPATKSTRFPFGSSVASFTALNLTAFTDAPRLGARASTGEATLLVRGAELATCTITTTGSNTCSSLAPLNFTTAGTQDFPSLTVLPHGRRIAIWSSALTALMRPF